MIEIEKQLVYVFCNPNNLSDEFEIRYKIRPTSIGRRFLKAMTECLVAERKPSQPERIYIAAENIKEDKSRISKMINNQIQIINSEYPQLIRDNAKCEMTNLDTNRLHKHFEVLRGSASQPTDYYLKGSPSTQQAFDRFNSEIHSYENVLLSEKYSRGFNQFVWSWDFKNSSWPRFPLEDSDYKDFTLEYKFGTLYLNYCEVGKQLIDIYRDNDFDIVSQENIRPLRYYSADTFAWLGPDFQSQDTEVFLKGFYQWWDQHNLDSIGFKKSDPSNALGSLPVADMVNPVPDLLDGLKEHQWQKRAYLIS